MLATSSRRLSNHLSPSFIRSKTISGLSAGSGKCAQIRHDSSSRSPPIPAYLSEIYWWAYLHPRGVYFFERPWLVNLILWGNYDLLANSMIREIDPFKSTLQIACAYGSVTPKLAQHMQGSLDVVDVAPIQLENLKHKLEAADGSHKKVHLSVSDAANLTGFADASREQVVFFFLLHELPLQVRRQALAEAWRVLSVSGKLVVIDYHQPTRWSFQRYFMPFVFHALEPFAMDLWKDDIVTWLPEAKDSQCRQEVFFQGFYQKVVIAKER